MLFLPGHRALARWVGLFASAALALSCDTRCGGLDAACCPMQVCDPQLACRSNGGLSRSAACAPCGASEQTCCDTGAPCGDGLACVESVCEPCGAPTQPCCATACNVGAACEPAFLFTPATCVACGGIGEQCCSGRCLGALACHVIDMEGDGTCVACGGNGEACCTTDPPCAVPLSCDANGVCSRCGAPGEACCEGLMCANPAVCLADRDGGSVCSTCGNAGSPCCDGVSCNDRALACSFGTCVACGALGQACCDGGTCSAPNACSMGVCAVAPVDAGGVSSACTASSCDLPGMVCIAYPEYVCSHACGHDSDCSGGTACGQGLCEPTCTLGGHDCDAVGGACFATLAPYTSLVAVPSTATPTCIPSCFPAFVSMPAGFTGCAAGTVCDLVSGECVAAASRGAVLGAACTGAGDCAGYCIAALDTSGVPTGFIGGYCVTFARDPPPSAFAPGAPLPSSNCATGGVALPMRTSVGGDAVACYAACSNDCDCRLGYHCDHDPMRLGGAPAPNGACLPIDCSQPGAACPSAASCDHGGALTHLAYPVCTAPAGGGDAGYDATARNAGCVTPDAGDASVDAVAEGGIDATVGG